MTSRVSIPVVICALAGVFAAVALFRPAADTTSPAPAAAAASADADTASAPPAAVAGASIQIADFAFGAPLTVSAGTAIDVVNVDGAPHTVTALDGSFDTGTLDGGALGSFTAPSTPGTYEFFCAIHPSMTGSLVVTS